MGPHRKENQQMTTNGNETPEAPVANLRQTRKEMAAAKVASKAAHPAGRQTAAKAAAKTAPAKTAGSAPASTKLRWQFPDGFDNRQTTGQTASFDGGELAMKPHDGTWKATFSKGGKTTVLAENCSAAKAYAACVGYAKGAAA
jgi:hypothetical protein